MDSSSINLHVHCVTLTQDFAYQHKISIPISTNSVYGKLLVTCTDAVVMNRVKLSLMAFRQAACQGMPRQFIIIAWHANHVIIRVLAAVSWLWMNR